MIADAPDRKSDVPVARFVDVGDGMRGFELKQSDVHGRLLFAILFELQELKDYARSRFG